MITEYEKSGHKGYCGTAHLAEIYDEIKTAETEVDAASFGSKALEYFQNGYKIVSVKRWTGFRWLGRLFADKDNVRKELPR